MKRGLGLSVFLFVCLVGSCCLAGETLSIRLVEASNGEGGKAEGLRDVVAILKKSLNFSEFRMVAACSLPLPVNDETRMLDKYAVKCSGAQDNLAITVRCGKKQLLNTKVSLRDDKPLILGGFPGKSGEKLLLVFLAGK